ncbi:MAG: TonB-dependent receptor [Bacteroidales bacterium]
MYGLEAVYNDVNSTGTDRRYYHRKYCSGAYSLIHVNLVLLCCIPDMLAWVNQKVTLQAGARYNYFNQQNDFDTTFYHFPFTSMEINSGALTGSLGLIYKPLMPWTISTNFSTGFRAPNVDDAGRF